MVITSKSNQKIKELRQLFRQKKAREESGTFPLEGIRLCGDALDSGATLLRVFATREIEKENPELVSKLQKQAQEYDQISEELAHWVADTKTPQGLFVVAEKLDNQESVVTINPRFRYLFLENIQDPGNMGTILRTALALGVDGCVISAESVELYSPKVVRSSMGAVLKLPIVLAEDISKEVARFKKQGISIYAAALEKTAQPLDASLFQKGSGILLGNEGSGLTPESIQAATGTVMIPMTSGTESLNVASAAAILLWEMNRGKMQEKE